MKNIKLLKVQRAFYRKNKNYVKADELSRQIKILSKK